MACAVWTPLAESEVEEILFYIRVLGGRPETSRRIGQELCDCVDRQAAKKSTGHKHPNAPEGWQYIQYKRWLIYYQPHVEGIEVMRVVDAARDLPSFLH